MKKDIARRKVKMSRQVSQIINDKEGTVTVVSTDDQGRQYASTESYHTSSSFSREDAIERATQDSLNKS